MLQDHYTFHKASTKIVKSKQYKAWRGANDIIPDYILPPSYHIDHWEKEMERLRQAAKLLNPNYNPMDEFHKQDVKMPSKDKEKDISESSEKIIIPGLTDKKETTKKSMIMEMESDKYTPNFDVKHITEDGQDKVVYTFSVPEENTAKEIDMDVSST